ncbi:MAG: GAF domain-containing protein [Candidatus Competibacteraceae bacterium]|nr:GAF domain-containing protein [Candidatus Competibacteraceae bacterium]
MSTSDSHANARSRNRMAAFTLFILILSVGAYDYYQDQRERIRQEKYQEIAAISQLKASDIERWRQRRLADAERIAKNPFIQKSLAAWRKSPETPGLLADGLLQLKLEQEAQGYAEALLLDQKGNVLLATRDSLTPMGPITEQIAQLALVGHSAILSDLYRASDGHIYLDAVALVPDVGGRPPLLLVLRSDAAASLYPLLQSWPTTPSRSAEILLIRREGDAVVLLNGLRHRPKTAPFSRMPLNQSKLPAAPAALEQKGLFQGQDYRGAEVLADLRPVSGASWFLVAKVDTNEILAEARYRARMIGVFIFLCLLLAIALTAMAYWRQRVKRYRNLYESERQERESREESRTALYSIGDAVITTDRAGRVRQMNAMAEHLTGWLESEGRGQALQDVFHLINEKTRAAVETPVEQVLREETGVRLAHHTLLIARDGSERPIADSSAPIRDDSGAITGVVLVFRDQTERHMADVEIRRNEARMRSLTSILQYPANSVREFLDYAFNEAIQLTGSQFGYLYRYDEDRRVFMLNSRSPAVMPAAAVADSESYYELDKAGIWGEAIRQRRPILINDFSAAHPLKKGLPEGHAQLSNFLTVPVFSEEKIVGVIGVANKAGDYDETDILQLTLLMDAVWRVMERREAEDKERQAVHSLRMLSDCNKAIALAEEAAGLMRAICRILVTEGGWRLAWVGVAESGPDKRVRPVAHAGVGENHLEQLWISWDESPSGRGPTGVAIRTGQPAICLNLAANPDFVPWREQAIQYGYGAALALPLKGEAEIWGALVLYAAHPEPLAPAEVQSLHRLADNLAYALRVLRMKAAGEQAAQKRDALETQLRQAQKMEAVGRLAGGIAHDFNNMLAVITGHVELALDETVADCPLYADLMEIKKAAQRSAELTRQLLAFARIQTILPKVLDLNDTIAGMLKMLKRLIGEDIDLVWKPAPQLGPVKVDPAQIDQILANLIVNARDAITGVGKITLETSEVVLDETLRENFHGMSPGSYVLLTVSDNGCGMDEAVLAQVFDPFFTTKPPGQGTGLGLATVYGIVKQNQGFINICSEPGNGATIRIYLPRHELDELSLPLSQAATAATTVPTGTETVLLVEDEAALLTLASRLLERLGYTVLAAANTHQARQLAQTHSGPIHLLLTDVIMPDLSGHELWRQISGIRPHLKCLFMSGHTANIIAHHGALDEGIHFLQKPFTREALAKKVYEVLQAR